MASFTRAGMPSARHASALGPRTATVAVPKCSSRREIGPSPTMSLTSASRANSRGRVSVPPARPARRLGQESCGRLSEASVAPSSAARRRRPSLFVWSGRSECPGSQRAALRRSSQHQHRALQPSALADLPISCSLRTRTCGSAGSGHRKVRRVQIESGQEAAAAAAGGGRAAGRYRHTCRPFPLWRAARVTSPGWAPGLRCPNRPIHEVIRRRAVCAIGVRWIMPADPPQPGMRRSV